MKKNLLLILALLILPRAVRAQAILPVDTTTGGFVGMAATGPLDQPVFVDNFAEFTATFGSSTAGLANPYLAPSVAGYFANGGVRLAVVRVGGIDDATVIGTGGAAPGSGTGLQALRDVDDVSFIAIPGVATPAVQAAMIAHCESEGDRLAILDPASPNDVNAIQVQRTGLATGYGFAALYFPWIQAAPDGTSLLLPPSGFVAGYYAATEPADSPVGIIATATGVAHTISAAEQDLLNPQGINAIRDLSGIRIWGARTLASINQWRYVSVRRLSSYIEESVTAGTAWCLQEPNDLALWTTLVQETDIFMYSLFVRGWLQGTQTSEAYFVRCGLGETMTQIDIDESRTILSLGFSPLVPAEFIVVNIVHQRQVPTDVPVTDATMIFHPAVPNPFNPATTLRFELRQESRVDLHVFDAGGRLVRKLMTGKPLVAGEYQRRWDGRDDGGRPVGSGVYLARFRTPEQSQTQRLVLVR